MNFNKIGDTSFKMYLFLVLQTSFKGLYSKNFSKNCNFHQDTALNLLGTEPPPLPNPRPPAELNSLRSLNGSLPWN